MRHGVLESLFCLERSGDHVNVDPIGDDVNDESDGEQTGPLSAKTPEPQHHDSLPLIAHCGHARRHMSFCSWHGCPP